MSIESVKSLQEEIRIKWDDLDIQDITGRPDRILKSCLNETIDLVNAIKQIDSQKVGIYTIPELLQMVEDLSCISMEVDSSVGYNSDHHNRVKEIEAKAMDTLRTVLS
jgi:hypothetical protein